jgi:hypothetical protein
MKRPIECPRLLWWFICFWTFFAELWFNISPRGRRLRKEWSQPLNVFTPVTRPTAFSSDENPFEDDMPTMGHELRAQREAEKNTVTLNNPPKQ